MTTLSERTTFSQPSQQKRAQSPVRGLLHELRCSKPSVFCESPSAEALPPRASFLQHHLMHDIDVALIPIGLKSRITDKYPSTAASIPDSAYDNSDIRSAQELHGLWISVEEILRVSQDCGKYQEDENAWCSKVVNPLLRLALKENSMLCVESVQTQTINPDVLPVTPQKNRLQRKADYTFSFHRATPEVSSLYNQLDQAGFGYPVSQTMDTSTKRLALFSGIEVKTENGGKDEALVQLAIWLCAGLEILRRLSESGQRGLEELFPTVGWTVIGHDWHTYIAYMSEEQSKPTFYVVGPWRVANADTRDVFGVFKLLRLISRAEGFASNEYWTWLRDEVLVPYTDN